MKSVGIKNLKNGLSRYIDMVRAGEVVYVTDRDEIVAEIHKPVSAPTRMLSRWEAFLNEEERKGSIRRAQPVNPLFFENLKKLKPLPGTPHLQKLLDETRAERF